jgi:hypothetical protein
MNGRRTIQTLAATVLSLAWLVGCLLQATPAKPTAKPTLRPATETPTETNSPTPLPPEHRIGIRVVDGKGEFYDRLNGAKFIPRGNNYIRLALQDSLSGGVITYHSTFNVGAYDPILAEESLQRMHAEGYNVVRVFLNGNCKNACIGEPAGGLSKTYLANVTDFLRKAKSENIFVILTIDGEPGTPDYINLLNTTWSESFGGTNANYLREGGILVARRFWQDLIDDLVAQQAPLDAILAYELRNELFFELDSPPFTPSAGIVETANGQTYDMASATDRQRMMDENLVVWIDQIRAAIVEHDPTALVTVGFFPPDAPNPWASAPRFIRTYPAVWQSSIDFIDFHPYPGGYSLDKLVENFGMSGLENKPIIMGEFGAARSTYATAAKTAQALHDWQVESCQYGFDGWLLWTWDTDEQADFYNGLTDEGQIDQALAPINRPDACIPEDFPFFERNVALGKVVRASRSLFSNPASNAVDGTTEDWWGAGDFAPQWIEIDLGEAMTARLFRLVASQSPAGTTRHELWTGPSQDKMTLLHTFDGFTNDLQAFEFAPESPVENIRFIRVVTKSSPSWVSWREIEVISP